MYFLCVGKSHFLDFLKNENIVFHTKSFYDEENDENFKAFECLNRDFSSLDEKYGPHISIIYLGDFLPHRNFVGKKKE